MISALRARREGYRSSCLSPIAAMMSVMLHLYHGPMMSYSHAPSARPCSAQDGNGENDSATAKDNRTVARPLVRFVDDVTFVSNLKVHQLCHYQNSRDNQICNPGIHDLWNCFIVSFNFKSSFSLPARTSPPAPPTVHHQR